MIRSTAVKNVTRTMVVLSLAVSISFALAWTLPGAAIDLSPLPTAWAQTMPTADCDADGDGYILDSNKCQKKNKDFPVDSDDSDCTKPIAEGCLPAPPDSTTDTPTCYIEMFEDTGKTKASTMKSDGLGPYEEFVDLVTCRVGDVVQDNTHPLRFRSVSNGNVAQAIRFVDLAFDFQNGCDNLEEGGCAALPAAFFEESEDSIIFQAKILGMDVEAIPPGESRSGPFTLDVLGYVERYAIQLRAAPANQGNFFCWDLDAFETISGGDPDYGLNIYAWKDTDSDGRPNGYTVTTGSVVSQSESFDTVPPTPPTILQTGPMQALVCSNVGADGSSCADKKDKNKLCHTLAIVDMYFTAHYIVP